MVSLKLDSRPGLIRFDGMAEIYRISLMKEGSCPSLCPTEGCWVDNK